MLYQSIEQVLGVLAHYDAQKDKYKMDNVILSAKGGEDEYITRSSTGRNPFT